MMLYIVIQYMHGSETSPKDPQKLVSAAFTIQLWEATSGTTQRWRRKLRLVACW